MKHGAETIQFWKVQEREDTSMADDQWGRCHIWLDGGLEAIHLHLHSISIISHCGTIFNINAMQWTISKQSTVSIHSTIQQHSIDFGNKDLPKVQTASASCVICSTSKWSKVVLISLFHGLGFFFHLDVKSFPLPVCSTTLLKPFCWSTSKVSRRSIVSIRESKLVLPTVTNTFLTPLALFPPAAAGCDISDLEGGEETKTQTKTLVHLESSFVHWPFLAFFLFFFFIF